MEKLEGFSCQFEKCSTKFINNTAIIYCDNERIINKLTYKDVIRISDSVKQLLERYVDINSCIGIATFTNPILPPVIIGIQQHQSPFLCIDIGVSSTKLLELVNRIQLKWILQWCTPYFENNFLRNYALLKDCLQFLNEYELKLWEIKDVSTSKLYKNISYIIQTSGTTGKNKIVKVSHDCIMSNISSLRKTFEIYSLDIIYIGTSLTFDPFVIELFLTLTSGACLLMVPPKIKTNKNILYKTLFPKNNLHPGVTLIQMSPSVFLTFPSDKVRSLVYGKTSLRILIMGGENFPEKIIKYVNRRTNLKIFNLYGITEVSCWASLMHIKMNEDISLGTPLDDTILEVRDSNNSVIQNGEGEMFIGSSVRICEIDDEDLKLSKNIVFRATGDIVQIKNNKYYFVGRKNSIIKRFGHRVCLLEIQKLVLENTELNSVCIWDENNLKLILFIILNEKDKINQNKIIDKLRIKLLHCLSKSKNPDSIKIIPALPLTQNGKTDLKCLLKIASGNNFEVNLNSKEFFQNLFSKYFGLSNFQLNENGHCSFLDLGGNSILAMQIISELENLVDENNLLPNLMELLLDKNKSYFDCCSFVEKNIKFNSKQCDKRKLDINNEQDTEESTKMFKPSNSNLVQLIIKWKYDLKACIDASPVFVNHPSLGNLIIAGSHSHICVILKAFSGELLSEIILPDAIEASACLSPCNECFLIGCNDGFMYFINIKNSIILWKFQTYSAIKCSPALCRDKTCIVFGSYDKNLYCISIKNGSLVWKNEISEIVKSKPVVCEKNGYIYVTTLQGSCFCICENSGKIILHSRSNNPIFGSPCIHNGHILWADVKGNVFMYKLENFDLIKCFTTNGFIFSSLCHIKNYILFGCHDHNLYCLNNTEENLKEIFRLNIGCQISTTPCTCIVNAGNADLVCFVIAGNTGKLHLFDLESRVLLDSLQLSDETFSSPIVNENNIYIGCRDNNLYCIEISNTK